MRKLTLKTKPLLLVVLLCLSVRTAQSQTFNLTVTDGIGTGVYNEGDTVHVWSKAIFGDSVFVDWTGSGTTYLAQNNEWHTTLTVPVGTGAGSLTLQANFDVIPSATQISSKSYLLFGVDNSNPVTVMKESFYAVPPSPKGVVFLLHGTGGVGESFFIKYERFSLVKDLVYAGFAVLALDANERTLGDQDGNGKIRWLTSMPATADASNNVDIKNLQALKELIINDFSLPSNIPCFTLGMSNGSVFSDICASALGFNASAHITAKGRLAAYTRPDIVPVIWIMSENDHNESADNAVAFNHFTVMSLNQTAEWHWLRRSPAYSRRFIRSLNGISAAQSDSVFNRLKSGGYLTPDSLLATAVVDSIPFSILDGLGLSASQKADIRQQLLVINADHVLHSDFDKNIIRFFNQTLSPVSVRSYEADTQESRQVSVYPNPASSATTIVFQNVNHERYTLKLFNILGQTVCTISNISGDRIKLTRNNLTSGLYFYQLLAGRHVRASGKLILK